MTAINHHAGVQLTLCECFTHSPNAIRIEIGPKFGSTQNQMTRIVTFGLNNGGNTFLGDGKEMVRLARGADGINSNLHIAISAILKTYRHGQSGCQLTMHLTFSRASPNCTPGDQVRNELWHNGIKKLSGRGKPHLRQFLKQFPGLAKSLVDSKTVVNVRIIDQPLPPNRGAGFFEIHTHEDAQVLLVSLSGFSEFVRIFNGGTGIVDGTGSGNHQ